MVLGSELPSREEGRLPHTSVDKLLISVMSMLAEPNNESPVNIKAAKMWKEERVGRGLEGCWGCDLGG